MKLTYLLLSLYCILHFSAQNGPTPVFAQEIPSPTPTPATISDTPISPILMDGMTVLGFSNPYTQEELDAFIELTNSQNSEIRNDTYYGTIFIQKTIFDRFNTETGESMPAFLARHQHRMSMMLRDATPAVAGGIVFRRIIITDESISRYPASYHLGYLDYGLTDSDGTWFFDSPYLPTQSAYYDANDRIDYGLLHEFGHSMLHLNDQYRLDVSPNEIAPSLVSRIPAAWQGYYNGDKIGVASEDLMATVGKKFQQYTALQLARRPDPHAFAVVIRDYLGWNAEYPASTTLKFNSATSLVMAKTVKVYRKTTSTGMTAYRTNRYWDLKIKALQRTSSFLSLSTTGMGIPDVPVRIFTADPKKGLTVKTADLFKSDENGLIPYDEATILLEITDTKNAVYYRFMDIRDFNTAKWTDTNTLAINVPTVIDTPKTFAWTIAYSVTSKNIARR